MPKNNDVSPEKRNLLIEQLEERVLFDAVPVNPVDVQSDFNADAMAFVQSSMDAANSAEAAANDQAAEEQASSEIVFVDKSVEGFEDVVAEFVNGRDVEVFFINEGSAGLTQIADHLEGRTDIAAIHIISHGQDAQLFLGDSVVTANDLQGQFSADLQRIGESLSESGDILIYGCELAATEQGESFIQTLSEITNADVAASDDLTGAEASGGDWILERQSGSIEANSFSSASFEGLLLVTDNGFVVGDQPISNINETAVTPLSEGGTSSRLYAGAATANGGTITIDLRLTLIDTFDEFGNVTTGTSSQMPVTFTNFLGAPIILSRNPGAGVQGYQGHTVHVMVEFFDQSTGNPLSVVGDFTFKDIDYIGPSNPDPGKGSEAVTIVSDQLSSYSISNSPTSSIETIDNGDGTTSFTNTTTSGGENDQERWVSAEFEDMTQLNLRFTARDRNTGYGMSTANFSATPLTFTQPVATDDGFTTDQDTAFVGNVIASNNGNGIDSDPDGDTLTVYLVNGAPGNVGSNVTGSSGGTFVINSNGALSFDPGSDFDYLAQGESTTTTVTYTISDGSGSADTATVTVTVTGINDSPNTVGTIPGQSSNDNESIAPINVSEYFADADTSDSLTFSAGTTLPPGLTIDPNTGVISGIIDNSASLGGPYVVVISANDGNGGTTTQSFTWAVANPGPNATNNSAVVKEDVTLTDSGNVISDNDGSGVDSDPDNDSLSVSAVNGVGANVGVGISGLYGDIQIDANGNYTYTLNNNHAAVSALDNGETLSDSFTYTLTDGEGGTSTATVTVTIDGTNDVPIVGGIIPNQSSQDDETITTLDVTSYFSDPDGDTLTYTATNLPAGLSLDLNNGLITGTIDNSASQGGTGGVYTVNVTATDDNGESVSTTLTWTVANPGPTANNDTWSTDEATGTSGDVITASDTDPDGDTLTVNAVNGLPANVGNVVAGSTGGEFTINSDGTYSFDPNGDFEDLDVTEFRDTVVTYTITDGEGGTDTATLTVTVNGINDAPTVGGTISSQSDDDADTITTLDVTSAFSDPEGDTLTYTATGLPAGLTLDLNSGEITGTIDNSASQGGPLLDGVYSVEVTATDDNGESVSTTFTWTVANPGPTATDNSDGVLEGASLTGGDVILDDDGFGVDNDVDGDTLVITEINGSAALVGVAVTGSNGGEFTTYSNGSYSFDTNSDFDYLAVGETATTQVSYTVSDGEGGVSSATLTITVTGTNDDPTQVGSIPDQADIDSGSIGLDVSSYFDDADTLDSLSFTATGLPTGLSIDSAGNITGTLDSSASQGGPSSDGVYAVTVTASDGNGGTVDQTFAWSITNVRPVADHDIHSTDADVVLTGNNVLDNDMDPDGDTITVTALGNAVAMWPASVGTPQPGITGGIFTVNSDGSWAFDPNGEFDYLAPGQQATSYVYYQIQDADGSLHSAVIGIYIDGVNDAPDVVGTIADQSDLDGETPATIDVTSAFNDPEGDTLTYNATGLPGGLSLDMNSGEITGTIDADASQGGPLLDGVYSVEVTATDAGGESSSTTFTWTIGNPAPTAADNSGSVTEDTDDSTSGNVILDNDGAGVDTDPDGDTLVVTSVNGSSSNVDVDIAGTYGNIRIDSDGTYSYDIDASNLTVNALDNGDTLIETITYTIDDGEGGSDTATLTITINGSNDDPIVGGTIAPQSDLDAETITAIDVTSVFSDPEGDTLTYTATGLPAGLSLDLNTGLITGTIDNSASQGGPLSDGVYTVQVRATDDNFSSVTTTFTWTIGNPAPTATSNMAAVTEDTSLTDSGNVITDNDGGLGVDSDPDSDMLSVGAVNGLPGNVGIATGGTYGSIQINSDGSYTYTLDNNNPAVSALDNGETLSESFTYTLSDGEGGTSVATIAVTINGTNDAPLVAGSIPDQSDNDDDTITAVDVTSYFSDPDGDTLTYTATNLPAGLSLDLNSGLITGTVDNSASQGGTGGVYTVTVTATDDNGETISSNFTWTVANPGPTATDNTAAVTEDTSTTDSGNVITDNDGGMGVDSDPDNDVLAVSAVNGVGGNVGVSLAGTYGSIQINSDGSYTYTLDNNNAPVSALDNGETLSESFSYTVSDGEGGTSTAVLSITVNGTNDAPLVGGTIPDQANDDDETITSVDVSSYFSDPDGDTLTYTATNLPAGLSLDLNTGLITGTIDNSASQGGVAGDYSVTVTATDDNGDSVSTTLSWTVTNPGPTATDNTASVTQDTTLTDSGNVITDNDGSGVDTDPDNDLVSVGAVEGVGSNVGMTLTGMYGDIQINSDGSYTYTLDNGNPTVVALDGGDSIIESFTYTLSDGEGGTSTATLTITVNGANDAPVVGGTIPDQANDDDDAITTVDVTSYFSDPDGDTLTYTATNLPAGLSLDLNSGLITGTIDNSASQGGAGGIYTVTVTATDDDGESVSTTLSWTVTNPGPTATSNMAAVTEDTSLTDSGNVITDNDGGLGVDSDPDSDMLSVGAVNGLSGNVGIATGGTYGSIQVNSDGSYTYTLDNNNAAVSALDNGETLSESFTYTLTDGEGGTSIATIAVTINGTNDTPVVAGSIPDQSDNDDDTITAVDVTSYFSDPDGDTLTYTATNLPAGLSLDLNSGLITGTVDNSASQGGTGGVYTVTVTATDDNGETISSNFTWTVANPGPTATDNTASVTEDILTTDSGNVITDNDGSGVDSDPDNDVLSVGAVEGFGTNVGVSVAGTYGSIQIDGNGDYTYTLDNNDPAVSALDNGETLSESFDYTVTDSEGGTSIATIAITINGTNDTPMVAGSIPDQSDNDDDTITAVDVTGFFSDPDGDTLTYTASNLPSGLSLDLNSGLITGTIDNSASQGGVLGIYSVTVTATDDNGETVSSTFDWAVTNPDPTATSNTASVTADTSLTDSGNVIADDDGVGADADPDSDALSVSAVDGVAGNVGMTLTGSYGDIQINSDGTYTYTLDNTNPAVTALDSGDSISESFTYTLSDGEGGFSTATLTVTVNGANDAPIVGGTIPDQAHDDDETITTVDVTSYFSDPDGDTLTYTATDLPAGLSLDLNSGLITGTVDNSASQGGTGGVYSVTVTATDDNGASVSTTMTWTVTNPAPTAADNTAVVTEDTSLSDSGNVIADNDGSGVDSDPDNDLLTVSAVNGSATNVDLSTAGLYGSIQINSDGSYTYTLDNNNPAVSALDNSETLTESFTYTASDGEGGTSVGTLIVTINGTNDAPVVGSMIPDQVNEDADTISTLDVTSYFSDPDGDTLTYTSSNLPAGLSLDLNSGQITGTVDNSASQGGTAGVYTVSVTAMDDNGEAVTSTFTWTISNPGPTATDDFGPTTQSATTTGSVIANDFDIDGDIIIVNAVDGSPANVGIAVTGSGGGLFTIESTGAATFDPNGDFDFLADGEMAVSSVSYTITDSEGGTATATVTVTVTGTNDTPTTVGSIPPQSSIDGETISTLNVSGFFDDVDTSDGLTFTATGLPTGLSIDAAGNITGAVDNSASLTGTFTVTVTANDGNGGTVDQVFDWTVSNPVPIANNEGNSTSENATVGGDVVANDSDPDGDSLGVAEVNGSALDVGVSVTGTNGGSFTLLSDGSYTFNPGTDFDYLAVGETVTTSVDYTISDGEGGTAMATLTITVNGTNDTPTTLGSIPDQGSVDDQSIVGFDVSGYFTDADTTDSISFTAVGLPTGLTINALGVISGTIDNSASQSGPFLVTVTAADGEGGMVDQTFSWAVTNPGPTASDNTATVVENSVLTDSGNVITDNDGAGADSDPDGDALAVSAVEGSGVSVGVTLAGSFGDIQIDSNGDYTYTLDNTNPTVSSLDAGDTLIESFTYTVSDGEGGTSTASLTITISGQNDAPVVGGTIPNQADFDSDMIGTVDVSSFFTDPESKPMTYSATGLPTGLAIDGSTGEIKGTLDSSASSGGTGGVYSVTVTATDDAAQSVSTTFIWTVTNPGPVANDDGFNVDEDAVLSATVATNDSDSDNDALVYTQTSPASNGVVVFNNDGSFTYTPDADFNGTETFDYQVEDADGAIATATVTITVDPVNDGPVVDTPIADQASQDSEVIALDISGNFSDIDGDTLSFSATGLPAGLTMDAAGNISGTIDSSASASGPYTVVVTVTDGNRGSVTDTFSWAVANPAPTSGDDSFTTDEDVAVSGSVAGNDGDVDGDLLTYAQTSLPANGAVVFNSDGTFTYTPTGNFNGTDSFDYLVTDADGLTSTSTVTITVDAVNDGPVVDTPIGDQSNLDSDVIVLDISSGFSDVDGDLLTFIAAGLPTGLVMNTSGNITGTIDASASASGPFTVVVTVTDGNGGSISDTFTWNVTNPAPVANNDGFTANEDTAFMDTVAVNDGDADGDLLVYSQLTTPANGAVVFNSDGSFTCTPDADFYGTDSFDYLITDADGATSTATVTITVDPVNDDPLVGSPVADQSSIDSEVINLDISGQFSDVDGDTLTFSATGLPTGLTMDAAGNITGTIDSSASVTGSFTVLVTVDDGFGGTVTDTFTWTVTNPAPDAVNDSVTTAEDVSVSGDVSTNDSDPDGDTLLFNQLTNPADGTVVFNANGTFVYSPNLNFTGIDSFDYEILDADGSSTTATVTIVVGDVNDPPVVATPIPDQANLDLDAVSLDVSGNFSDVEMDPLTFSATGLPTGLTISPAGLIAGTIDNSASLTGPFTVVVTADDGNGGTVTDTFNWTVNNPAPTATDNSNSATEDGASVATGDVIMNDDGNGTDSDPDNDMLFVSAVDGVLTDVGVNVTSTYGTVQINGDGTYVYTLDNSNPLVNSLDNGETLSESFTYTLNDGEGGTSTATLTVTINGTNDAPNTTGTIADQSNLDADTPVLDVSTMFADADGDSLLYSITGLPGGLSLNPISGLISGTIDRDASQGGSSSDGIYSVTVTASDDNGETTATTFTWTVANPVPDAQDDSFTIAEDTGLTASVVGNDSDPDSDPVSYTLLSGPAEGTITFNPDGTFDYTPDADFFGVDSFDYQLQDADGDVSTASVTINVTSVNDDPAVDPTLPDLANFDSDVVSLDVSSNFVDVEGDTLSFVAIGLPTGLLMDVAGNISGTIDSSASSSGPFSVVVTADDGNGGVVTGTFTWSVTNPAPNAVSDSFSTSEDTSYSDTVATNDVDPDGDMLTFSLLSGPSNGTLTFNPDGSFTYDPAAGYNGLDSFDYQVIDADGLTSTATATINIGAVNDLPVVDSPIPDQVNWDDETILLDLSGTFSDPDGDSLAFSATGLPSGLAIDSVTGIVTGTIDNNASSSGPYTVVVTVDDGNGGTMSDSFVWTVNNPAPVSLDDSFTVDEDTSLSATVASNDSDPDGDTMTHSMVTGPTNGSVVWNLDGTFTYTPNADYNGTDSFTYQTVDADGASTTAVATITIDPVNDAPVAMDDADTTNEDTPVTIDVLFNDVDPDGDPLMVSVLTTPANGTVAVNPDGSIEYTPNPDFNGSDSFDYEICDADGVCSSATVTINVVSVNDGPVAVDDSYSTLEDTPVMGNVGSNDSDPEGDALTFSLVSPPADGSLTFNLDGTFVFVPNSDFNGTTSFVYEVCDSFGDCDTATVTINVDPVNDPPVAIDDANSTSEDVSVILNLLGNDTDPESDPLQVVEINGVSLSPGDQIVLPSGAKVILNADGTAVYDPNGQFDDLKPGHTAIDTFLYTIDDGNGGTDTAEAVVTINGVNDPPVAEDDYVTTTTDTPVTIPVLANDSDVDMDTLAVVLLSSPPEGTTSVNPDGTITFTPDAGFEGTVTIHYLVEDPFGATSDATVTVVVEPAFRFDSFTNFSESNFAHGLGEPRQYSDPVLSQQIFTLAPEPIFSGYARPGTQVIGRIYDQSGSLVGEASANTDPGGNWMMQFHSAKGHEFYRIEFEQIASGSYDVYGYMGLNASDNSYQSMEPLTVYDRPLSVEGAMESSGMSLEETHRHNRSPQGFGK